MEENRQKFRTAYEQGRVHHAWLLVGHSGSGKRAFAHRAARLLIGGDEAADIGGGSLLQIGHSETGAAGTGIATGSGIATGIDELRQAKRFAMLTSESNRVIIIHSLDAVSIEGCNALLKILEEPPPKAFFFLLSDGSRRPLPTIRSRCRRMQFKLTDNRNDGDRLAALVERGDEEQLAALKFLSDGSPSRAEALLREDGEGDKLKLIFAAVKSLPSTSPQQILAVINCFKRDRRSGSSQTGSGELWQAWQRAVLAWVLEVLERDRNPAALNVWDELVAVFNGYRFSYLDPRQTTLAVFHHCRKLLP